VKIKIFNELKDIVTKKDSNYYKKLYGIQDRVLEVIFGQENPFYITGGTALQRFHNFNIRYSDDLDLFFNTDNSELFHSEKEKVIELLSRDFDIRNAIDIVSEYGFLTKNNYVYILYYDTLKIKIQFVQDLRKKTNTSLLEANNGIKYDNIENILTNKIAAFYYRESLKDFIDLVTIGDRFSFEWGVKIYQTKIDKLHRITTQLFIEKFFKKYEQFKNDTNELLKMENILLTESISINEIIQKSKKIGKDLLKLLKNGQSKQKQKRKRLPKL